MIAGFSGLPRATSREEAAAQLDGCADAVKDLLRRAAGRNDFRPGSKKGQVPLPERPAGCFAQRYLTPFLNQAGFSVVLPPFVNRRLRTFVVSSKRVVAVRARGTWAKFGHFSNAGRDCRPFDGPAALPGDRLPNLSAGSGNDSKTSYNE